MQTFSHASLCERTLMHSKYSVFSAEVCDLGHTYGLRSLAFAANTWNTWVLKWWNKNYRALIHPKVFSTEVYNLGHIICLQETFQADPRWPKACTTKYVSIKKHPQEDTDTDNYYVQAQWLQIKYKQQAKLNRGAGEGGGQAWVSGEPGISLDLCPPFTEGLWFPSLIPDF